MKSCALAVENVWPDALRLETDRSTCKYATTYVLIATIAPLQELAHRMLSAGYRPVAPT